MELIIVEGAFVRLATILKDHLTFLSLIVLPNAFKD